MKGNNPNLDARIDALPTLAEKLDAYHRALLDYSEVRSRYLNGGVSIRELSTTSTNLSEARTAYESAYLESFQWR